MNIGKILVIFLVAVFLGFVAYKLINERKGLEEEFNSIYANTEKIMEENKSLSAKIDYFQIPENLVKELKSKFNYKEQGEKLIITIPNAYLKTSTSTTSTSPR